MDVLKESNFIKRINKMDENSKIDMINKVSDTAKTIAETIRILFPENFSKKNEYILDEKVKEKILDDNLIPFEDRLALYYGYTKVKKQYINRKNILDLAEKYFGHGKEEFYNEVSHLKEDWFEFFMGKVENISDERVQKIWAGILAEQLEQNRNGNIKSHFSKKLITILSLMESEDITAFYQICSMTFDSLDRKESHYPFIYIADNAKFYANCELRRYNLASLSQLGLIEYNGPLNNFVLPVKVPRIKYFNIIVEFDINGRENDRISNGNIRFTNEGRILYGMTNKKYNEYFLKNCKKMWDSKNYRYTITEMN